MLSIHYVSIMMRIFYTDWQQHWGLGMPPNREYWWSTKQPQVTDLPRWQFGFQWRRRGIELVFKSLDCFTKRLFHTATFFCCYICICCLKLHQADDYKVEEFFFCFFFNLDLVGEHSAPMYLPVYYLRLILISRPPRVFRRFKRRSCIEIQPQGKILSPISLCSGKMWKSNVKNIFSYNFPRWPVGS